MDYRVYFTDGNRRNFHCNGIYDLIAYLCFEENYSQTEIWKIEEIQPSEENRPAL